MEEVEGQVVVKADKRDLLRGRRAPAVLRVEVNEEEEGMVVIGGGAAGHTAVETLRFASLVIDSHIYHIYITDMDLFPEKRVSEAQSHWSARSLTCPMTGQSSASPLGCVEKPFLGSS